MAALQRLYQCVAASARTVLTDRGPDAGGCSAVVVRLCKPPLRDVSESDFEFEVGSGTGIRTLNLAVNSRLLYRLSYPGTTFEF